MKSRITLVVAALLGLAVAPAIAQGPPGGGMGGQGGFAQRRMQMMLNGITLTATQQAKIDSIQKAYQDKMPPMTPGQMPDSATRAQRFADAPAEHGHPERAHHGPADDLRQERGGHAGPDAAAAAGKLNDRV